MAGACSAWRRPRLTCWLHGCSSTWLPSRLCQWLRVISCLLGARARTHTGSATGCCSCPSLASRSTCSPPTAHAPVLDLSHAGRHAATAVCTASRAAATCCVPAAAGRGGCRRCCAAAAGDAAGRPATAHPAAAAAAAGTAAAAAHRAEPCFVAAIAPPALPQHAAPRVLLLWLLVLSCWRERRPCMGYKQEQPQGRCWCLLLFARACGKAKPTMLATTTRHLDMPQHNWHCTFSSSSGQTWQAERRMQCC